MCASFLSADLLCWPMRSPFASDSESSGGPSPSWERTPGQKRDRSTPASSVPEEDEEPEVDESSDMNEDLPSEDKSPRPKKSSGSGSGKPRRSSSEGSASAANPYAETLKGRCNCQDLLRVECVLENKDLWEKFNELGTEMIITKTGR
ncbi:t-box protein H15-2 [Caerostris darwini]|uniref:T-box protein H15-2 n=1 Tax=Caerostris darwini TaxID=1538125 RepID=A0AAV4M304_9ARAC|nr:t-box protein H15-2 [Caerostris darwini]